MARQSRAELLLSNARRYSRGDCPEICRERRRRRIQMRQSRSCSAARPETSSLSESAHSRKPHFVESEEEKEEEDEDEEDNDDHPVEELSPPRLPNPMPISSTISIKGFEGRNDGKLCVHEDFCRPNILGGRPLHFFAVYDGDASALYKELMHRFIAEELTCVDAVGESAAAGGSSGESSASPQRRHWRLEDHLRTALRRSFERMDRVALGACWCIENGHPCKCKSICRLALESSAATVVVLTAELIVVAHSGVSRVVLCRGGIPVRLSHDHHKVFCRRYISQRQPEPERSIIPYHDGVRVYGIHGVSHHLGNHAVRSSVITSQPEISITERRAEDECLILASDGVWEVISNDTACNIATTCLRDGNTDTSSIVPLGDFNGFGNSILLVEEVFPTKSNVDAAALLCRLALGRGSSNSMSVIVVDLKRH